VFLLQHGFLAVTHVAAVQLSADLLLPALRLTAGPSTPVAGLYCCGDSRFPGIGLPAVAASGAICANTLVPVWQHWQLLDELAV
jgi:phytoene dehydrogenase-like protein